MELMNRIADNPLAERVWWGMFALFFGILGVTATDGLLQIIGIGLLILSLAFFGRAMTARRTQNED